jgi:PII-like signaling protein
MGFGASSRMHTTKILRLSEDMPMVIEIVDTADKIDTLIPFLDENVKEGLITKEVARVIKYRHNKK